MARATECGALAFLAHTCAIFAFQVVINPLTPVHSAMVGSAGLVTDVDGSGDVTAGGDLGRPPGLEHPRRADRGVPHPGGGLLRGPLAEPVASAIVTTSWPSRSRTASADEQPSTPAICLRLAGPGRRGGLLELRRRPKHAGREEELLLRPEGGAISIVGLFADQAARELLTAAATIVPLASAVIARAGGEGGG